MIKVDQRRFTREELSQKPEKAGDCLSACLASMLEIPLEDVPVFSGLGWPSRVNEFLRPHGFYMVGYPAAYEQTPPPDTYHIVSGPVERLRDDGTYEQHAVIAWENSLVHDPNSSRTGITELTHRWILVPLDLPLDVGPRSRIWKFLRSPFFTSIDSFLWSAISAFVVGLAVGAALCS